MLEWFIGDCGYKEVKSLAIKTNDGLQKKGMMLATAESCTGGWVAKMMTDIAGSSTSFDRGFVTYSNLAKQEMLGVSADTLNQYGAVSEPVVKEMVLGALHHSVADIALSISGIAGPSGGSADKPVGTVCFAWGVREGELQSVTKRWEGDREEVRQQAVIFALEGVLKILAQ